MSSPTSSLGCECQHRLPHRPPPSSRLHTNIMPRHGSGYGQPIGTEVPAPSPHAGQAYTISVSTSSSSSSPSSHSSSVPSGNACSVTAPLFCLIFFFFLFFFVLACGDSFTTVRAALARAPPVGFGGDAFVLVVGGMTLSALESENARGARPVPASDFSTVYPVLYLVPEHRTRSKKMELTVPDCPGSPRCLFTGTSTPIRPFSVSTLTFRTDFSSRQLSRRSSEEPRGWRRGRRSGGPQLRFRLGGGDVP